MNDLLDIETQAVILSKSIPSEGFKSSLMAYIDFVNNKLHIDHFLSESKIFSNFTTVQTDGKIIFKVDTPEFGIKMFTYDTASKKFMGRLLIKELANYGLKYSL